MGENAKVNSVIAKTHVLGFMLSAVIALVSLIYAIAKLDFTALVIATAFVFGAICELYMYKRANDLAK